MIVLKTCCVAPPAANDWFRNVSRLEYTASALAPCTVFAPGAKGVSGPRRSNCRSPPGWSKTCAFACAPMAQATNIAPARNERRQGMARLLRSGAIRVPYTRRYLTSVRRKPISMTAIARMASANGDSVGIGTIGGGAWTLIDALATLPTPALADVTALVVLT